MRLNICILAKQWLLGRWPHDALLHSSFLNINKIPFQIVTNAPRPRRSMRKLTGQVSSVGTHCLNCPGPSRSVWFSYFCSFRSATLSKSSLQLWTSRVLIQSLNNSYQPFATLFFLLSQTPGWKDVVLWYGNLQLPGNSISKNSLSQVCIPAFPGATPTEEMAHPGDEQVSESQTR